MHYSPRILKEFKDNLPKSIIPIVLTVLGTLAFQSGAFLFDFWPKYKELRQQIGYEQNRYLMLQRNALAIEKGTPIQGFAERSKISDNFQNSVMRISEAERGEYRAKLTKAINEANHDLGIAEGYAGLESVSTSRLLNSKIEVFSAEIEVLEAQLACTEHPLVSLSAKDACLRSIVKHSNRLTRALSRASTVLNSSEATEATAENEYELKLNRLSRDFNFLFVKALFALLGLYICISAYGRLFSHFLEAEESSASTPMRSSVAKPDKQQNAKSQSEKNAAAGS